MEPGSATAEAASVVTWFEFYTRLYEDDTRVARPSRTLLQLLQSAFPTLYDEVVVRRLALGSGEWAGVILLLEAFYEVELGINGSSLNDAMTFEDASLQTASIETLEYVVSALVQSDSKARFVGDIMTMDDTVQVDIMAVIERVLQHTSSLASSRISGEDGDQDKRYENSSHENAGSDERLGTSTRSTLDQACSSSYPTQTPHSPLHLSRNAEIERLQRANEIIKEDNVHIAKELGEMKAKLSQAEAENATLLETIQSVRLQAEMDVLKKERSVRSHFDERLHSLQRELDRVSSELDEKTAAAKELNELRDEIDLLRPSADKLARAEATLAKYKTKIEDLASVNEKLRRTEEANSDLVEKNLLLESQAAKATMLQRKLADSKEANTAIQFQVSELESKLAKLATELEAKRLECDSMSASLVEAKSLNQQLQQIVDQLRDGKSGLTNLPTGSAGGISELNPELMEKLARLEHENCTLRSQVDSTTSERIDALLDEIDDLKRMKKSFEAKYFDSSDLLKESETNLSAAQDTISKLQADLDMESKQLREATHDRDNLARMLELAKQTILELTDANRGNIEEINRRVAAELQLNAEVAQRNEELTSLRSILRTTSHQLLVSNERADGLSEDVISHQMERSKMAAYNDELQIKVQNLEDQCTSLVGRAAETEVVCEDLRQQLADVHTNVIGLRESKSRFAMRCEELNEVLVTKARQIEEQTRAIVSLKDTNRKTESNLAEAHAVIRSRGHDVQLLTERLYHTDEDLALLQLKRMELEREVIELQDQNRVHLVQQQTTAADLKHLMTDHASEIERLTAENADAITRMTGTIDEKCTLLQQIKNELISQREAHQTTIEQLRCQLDEEKMIIENQKNAISSEFAEYRATHSFSNEEVESKEAALQRSLFELSTTSTKDKTEMAQQREALTVQVDRLQEANRDMKTRFESQEVKLRESLRSQLDTNRKLMEVNQAIKAELAKKEAHVMQLQNAATRLDSKIRMFERERTHYSDEDGCRRESDETNSSYSSQFNSHVTQIAEELDMLRKENKKLLEQLSERQSDSHHVSSQQSTKSYLLERIRLLELAKSVEEDKKRELLLVNAKLFQDQKQIQVRSASDLREMQLLKEKVNMWMLRDERRKKEHEAFSKRLRDLETENVRLRSRMDNSVSECSSELGFDCSEESQEPLAELQTLRSDNQENIPPSNANPPSPTLPDKKRKLDSLDNSAEPAQSPQPQDHSDHSDVELRHDTGKSVDEFEQIANVPPTTRSPAPRAKRRMSLFLANRSASAAPTAPPSEEEKAPECHQQ